MNRYQDIMGRINYGLFLCVVALLPFPQVFLRYACVLWVVSWAMEGRWMQRPKSLRENRMAIPFLLFAAWYAWKGYLGSMGSGPRCLGVADGKIPQFRTAAADRHMGRERTV